MYKMLIAVILSCLLLSGCATSPRPTQEQVNAADCGPMPVSYKESIKQIIDGRLSDPYSAVYTFSSPQKSWNRSTGQPIYGWRVCGTVNAKNKFGGYVGATPFYALIRDEEVMIFVTKGYSLPDSFVAGMLSGNPSFYESICK